MPSTAGQSSAAATLPDQVVVKTEIDFDFDSLPHFTLDGVAGAAVITTAAAAASAAATTAPSAVSAASNAGAGMPPAGAGAGGSAATAVRFFGTHRPQQQQQQQQQVNGAALHSMQQQQHHHQQQQLQHQPQQQQQQLQNQPQQQQQLQQHQQQQQQVQQQLSSVRHEAAASTADSDDGKLQKLLQEFDLEILYTTLKLGCITFRSLRYLSTEDINATIHHIGYRAEFREKLFAWRKEKLPSLETPPLRLVAPHQPMTTLHRPPATTAQTAPPPLTMTGMVTSAPALTAPTATTTLARPKLQLATLSGVAATATVVPSPPSAIVQPERRAPAVDRQAPPHNVGAAPSQPTSTMTNSSTATLQTTANSIADDFLVLFDQTRNLEHALSMNLGGGSGNNNNNNNASNISGVMGSHVTGSSTSLEQPSTSAAAAAASAGSANMPFGQLLASTSSSCSSNNNNNAGEASSKFGVKPIAPSTSIWHLPKGVLLMSCEKVNVHNLLYSSHIGRTIRQFYNKNGYLENEQRNEIVRLVIEAVMQQGQSLCPKDFRAILNDIMTVFPNERIAADYYFIYRNGKGNPLGRLYQRYSNENSKRRRLTRLATTTPPGGGGSQATTDEDDTNSDVGTGGGGGGDSLNGLLDEEEDDSLSAYPDELPGNVPAIDEMTSLALKQLLTTDHFSWEEVCDKWIQTWALRQKELQQSNLAELLTHWAKLSDPRAAELYKIDFRHVYPGKENCLFGKWDEYVRKLTPIFEKKLNFEEMKKLYKLCKLGMVTKDEKDFVYAMGLTALLPSTTRFRDQSGKMRVRASIADAFESFVMRLTTLESYETQLELYTCKFGAINRTTHPFLVVVTPNEHKISKIYVALENRFYCMKSFLHALDLCYKIYHTCGLKYPTVCENVWTFVQRFFYDMHVPWEARNANLVALLVSLTAQS